MTLERPYFPLRWESTGDQWWYASPIDYAAANGHYDLVRELLRIDGNHLIKLTSLRRIRRLETVWDDHSLFHGAAKCRSSVARRLLLHCDDHKGRQRNSLIRAGYGGWLIYTAAAAGDLAFVKELLDRNPLLVFGEGEYGVTDVLYAAARGKSRDVFRLLLDSAAATTPGNAAADTDVYRWEMVNRAVHAAARGGNLTVLKELLAEDSSDVLAYRDSQSSTILHTAAARGQVEIVKYLIETFDVITASTDTHGNTALHVAAFRGQLAAAEAMISASPQLIYLRNTSGETFLHRAVSGFQALQFRPLERHVALLRRLVGVRAVVNAQNSEGRTALHAAVIGNVHSDLVHLLMTADSVDLNVVDSHGLTALDYLRRRPRSASSDVLIRRLVSAGAIFSTSCALGGDNNGGGDARSVIVSRMKMQGSGGSSPGSSFRISDAEIFLYAGIANDPSVSPRLSPLYFHEESSSSAANDFFENNNNNNNNRRSSFANAAQIFKQVLNWPKHKDRKEKINTNNNSSEHIVIPDSSPTPLRKRFSKPSSPVPSQITSNKRTLAVRSNQSSPNNNNSSAAMMMKKKKTKSVPMRSSRSSSFSGTASPESNSNNNNNNNNNKQKGVSVAGDIAGSSKDNNSKRMKSQYYLCFGNAGVSVKSSPIIDTSTNNNNRQSFKRTVSLAA